MISNYKVILQLADLDNKSFPREMHELGAVYWHSHDNKGQKIRKLLFYYFSHNFLT